MGSLMQESIVISTKDVTDVKHRMVVVWLMLKKTSYCFFKK